ncbi:hypothetical protein BDR06DRAFT_999878 [Suillus hirtellus]|nr:hypothetical protein BDR06DRAFT_999878 [Suillus hirtellus]
MSQSFWKTGPNDKTSSLSSSSKVVYTKGLSNSQHIQHQEFIFVGVVPVSQSRGRVDWHVSTQVQPREKIVGTVAVPATLERQEFGETLLGEVLYRESKSQSFLKTGLNGKTPSLSSSSKVVYAKKLPDSQHAQQLELVSSGVLSGSHEGTVDWHGPTQFDHREKIVGTVVALATLKATRIDHVRKIITHRRKV